jgi:hypothetical protein
VHTITMELVGSQVHDLLVVLYIGVHKIYLAVGTMPLTSPQLTVGDAGVSGTSYT